MTDARKGQSSDGCAQGFDLFWRMRATMLLGSVARKGGHIIRMRATYMTDACKPFNHMPHLSGPCLKSFWTRALLEFFRQNVNGAPWCCHFIAVGKHTALSLTPNSSESACCRACRCSTAMLPFYSCGKVHCKATNPGPNSSARCRVCWWLTVMLPLYSCGKAHCNATNLELFCSLSKIYLLFFAS